MKYYFHDAKGVVTSIYYVTPPQEALKQPHIESDQVFPDKLGYYQIFKVDTQTKVLTCEYIKTPPTQEDRIKQVETDNTSQSQLIDVCLLATDEMFMMLEPLLPQSMALKGGEGKMVDMYVAMVIRGLKTIEEVPARYKQEVKNILDKLEK